MRRLRALAPILVTLLAASCGGGDGSGPNGNGNGDGGPAANLPEACVRPPFTMRLEAGGTAPAGDAEFSVQDTVARRVAILPGVGTTSDPAELEANAEEAGKTDLALYQVYLSDATIDRSVLTGSGFGQVDPKPGETVGQLAIVPTSESGFAVGDIVDLEGDFEYEATTSFAELTLTVLSGEDPTAVQGYETAASTATVEILHVDDDALCLDVDIELTAGGDVIYAAEGVVTAEVVRAPNSFYFT